MTAIPDPYGRSTFHGKPLDNATIARLKQAETILGYELTILQGIGGAAASAGTHTEGRAVDLAPWDYENKVRVLRDLGFAVWHRPALPGVWGEHIHGVLVFCGRSNKRGIAPAAWRQIGSYDRGHDGLARDGVDPDPYRPKPARGFSLADYRRSFAPEPKPAPAPVTEHVDVVVATQNSPDKTDRPHWLARGSRAKAILTQATQHRVEILALQELATISRTWLLHRRYWRLVSAPFNNVFKTTALGNSVAYRRKLWRLLDTDSLKVPMANRRRGLNMPVLLLEDTNAGARVVVLAIHNPSNRPPRLGAVTRKVAKGMEVAYAQRCIAAGLPVVVLGDFNQADLSEFTAAGFKVAAQVGVDAILTHGCGVRGGGVDHALEGKASDHPMVWAKVRVPVTKSPRTLPKESA